MPNQHTTGFTEDRAREAADAVDRNDGNRQAAARELGIPVSTLKTRLQVAARQGYSPYEDKKGLAAPGYHVKGKSTWYPELGQWVKTSQDYEEQQRAIMETVQALKEEVPRVKPEKPPKASDTDLAVQYTITDYHFGQLSWGEETGEDWDTDIAEDLLVRWFGVAIESAPPAHTGIFAQLGDLLHHDGLEAITPTSGHLLDADTRFQRLVRVAIRSIRRVISLMLRKHQEVRVIMAEGNHDIASSVWLRELFAAFYEDEPRVIIENSPTVYYCIEWGDVSLFYHHGHKAKVREMSRVFAGQFRDIYGRTKISYAHCGHLHHRDVKEDSIMEVEQHPTLAARDAHSARLGLKSKRGAMAIVYHKREGEVGRCTITPGMVKAA